ncbi:MAG TPA: hypothetical protein VFR67_12575, partial [Pilimelia sp.]|nr:hypothetical protein [Pilimelia sp.]
TGRMWMMPPSAVSASTPALSAMGAAIVVTVGLQPSQCPRDSSQRHECRCRQGRSAYDGAVAGPTDGGSPALTAAAAAQATGGSPARLAYVICASPGSSHRPR